MVKKRRKSYSRVDERHVCDACERLRYAGAASYMREVRARARVQERCDHAFHATAAARDTQPLFSERGLPRARHNKRRRGVS